LAANTGVIHTIGVPIDPKTENIYEPLDTWWDAYLVSQTGDYDSYERAGPTSMELEIPLGSSRLLPTGNVLDVIKVQGLELCVTVINVKDHKIKIFLLELEYNHVCSMISPYDCEQRYLKSAILSELNSLLQKSSDARSFGISELCLISPMESGGYVTNDEVYVCCCQADILTKRMTFTDYGDLPMDDETTIALTVAQSLKGSIAYDTWILAQERSCGGGRVAEGKLDWPIVQGYIEMVSETTKPRSKWRVGQTVVEPSVLIYPKWLDS